jgi:hypothetical protein
MYILPLRLQLIVTVLLFWTVELVFTDSGEGESSVDGMRRLWERTVYNAGISHNRPGKAEQRFC